MTIWKVKGKGYRYRFQYKGEKYGKAWFSTKASAKEAEAKRMAEVKKQTMLTAGTFLEIANEYLDYHERRLTRKTFINKQTVFRKFLAFHGNLSLEKITDKILDDYLKTRPSNTNYNRHRKELCALFAWAWKRKRMEHNPCHFLEKLAEKPFVKIIPTPDEMHRLLLAAGRNRPFILVLYHTLARVDEVLRLRWQDVNFQERTVKLWTRKRRGGEWASDVLAMNQVLYDTLWNLWRARTQDEWVFLNPGTNTRYMRRPRIMGTICKRAGIRPFGFHAIRHFVASLLHDAKKVSVSQVSRILRHQSKATTEKYLQIIEPGLRAAMESLEDDFFTEVLTAPSHQKD